MYNIIYSNFIKENKDNKIIFTQKEDNNICKINIENIDKHFISFFYTIIGSSYIIINNEIVKTSNYINTNQDIHIKFIKKKNNIFHIIDIKEISSVEFELFNYIDYANRNKDINKSYHHLWDHWCLYGKKEKRQYKPLKFNNNLDWEEYIHNNYDLILAGINTKEKALDHWNNYGKKENRIMNKKNGIKHFLNLHGNIDYFQYIYVDNIQDIKLKNIKEIEYTHYEGNFIQEKDVFISKYYDIPKINLDYMYYVKNFILIIDFDNKDTQFLNFIVSHFKSTKTFLIARPKNNNIIFNVNEEYELNKEFSSKEAIEFLHKNILTLEKIFINHTMEFNIQFLKKLNTLKKEITTITHDFYMINDIPNPYIHELKYNYNNDDKLNINSCHRIITQHKNNLYIFDNHIRKKDIFVNVSELPNYREALERIETSNKKIIVGIISDKKDEKILEKLIQNNKHIDIIIFGTCHIPSYKHKYNYNSINELNELLKKFKPNVLLELSIYPETYSYTLTLSMITKLPILYFKKTGNFVVEQRLSKYDKAYSFNTIEQCNTLIQKHKQDYFYTIQPTIYFNCFWNKYFNSNPKYIACDKYCIQFFKTPKKKNIVIITRETRLQETIKSIQQNIPNHFIILLDNSELNEKEHKIINSNVDIFLNPSEDDNLKYYTDELQQTKLIVDFIHYFVNKDILEINNLFKISGNSWFKYCFMNNTYNLFKLNHEKIKSKYITKIETPITSNYIHEDDVLITKHYNKLDFSPEKISLEYINYVENMILIIDFFNGGGGTTNFINQIVSKYKMNKVLLIVRQYSNKIIFTINDEYEIDKEFNVKEAIHFIQEKKINIEKIFVNHTLGHSIQFLNEILKLKKEIITITHDYYLINDIANPMMYDIQKSYNNNSKMNINSFHKIITQNKNNLLILNSHIKNDNIPIIITDLPDYKENLELIHTSNNKLVIALLGAISIIKGQNILNDIIHKYKNDYEVEIILFGCCDIKDFKKQYKYHSIQELNELFIKFKPNILIELSLWPETYSYTLSLEMITKLPIIYKKKIGNFTVEDRLSKYDKAYPFDTLEEFDILIKLHKQDYFYTIKPFIYFNSFWDEYFNTLKIEKKINNNNIFNKINIYPIYFPQFHTIKENNISFYDGYNDVKNLKLLSQTIQTETPNLKEFELKDMSEYNLENVNIIQKQIDLLEDYNLSGFSMYYYWFSKNSITNNNMIMEKVIDIFFNNVIKLKNKKIFFIWANESWTNNPAFGNSNHKIENDYDIEHLNNNASNLIKYFKHSNYLKKDNKPVLLIYHEWFMNLKEIKLFENVLNNKCIECHFKGIHLIINSMHNPSIQNDFKTFYLNFNYKKSGSCFIKDTQIYLDYKKYMDTYDFKRNDDIKTIVFDFDNRARLFKPNKLNFSTICINNNLFNKILFMSKLLKHNNNNILLFNSWNEWGEKMLLEPSNEKGFFNLNILNSILIHYFKHNNS